MKIENKDETFCQFIDEIQPIKKQYSSINKRINSYFKNKSLIKLKENMHKKIKIYDFYGLSNKENNFKKIFDYYNINIKKINDVIEDLSKKENLPCIKKNRILSEKNFKKLKKKKINLKEDEIIKKKSNEIPMTLSQLTSDPGRYNPNYNCIYKKPFYPFFRKSSSSFFEQFKSDKNIMKKKIFKSSSTKRKFKSITIKTSRKFSFVKNSKFSSKNRTTDSFFNNDIKLNKYNNSESNKLYEKNIFSNHSNNNSKRNKKNFFGYETDINFNKRESSQFINLKKSGFSTVNFRKMLGRTEKKKNSNILNISNNYSPKYESIIPHIPSFKMTNKISFQNLKKYLTNKLIRNYNNISNDYLVMKYKNKYF